MEERRRRADIPMHRPNAMLLECAARLGDFLWDTPDFGDPFEAWTFCCPRFYF